MTDKQDPIAHAARLLREAAEELRQAHAYNNIEGWENETDAKAAYDEHLAAAQALEDWEQAVGAGGVSGPLMGIATDMSKEREALRTIGEEQAFEAWFKMDCPVEGANAKIAATAAWKARASLAANAGEPVAWMTFTEEGDPDMVFLDRLEACQYCEDDDPPKPLYLAAPPTAQAQGWQSIETAPKEGVFLVFMQDEVRPARRMQVANWHPNVKIVGGLFAFDCAKVTHWMPLPNPPTSAEGVEHG